MQASTTQHAASQTEGPAGSLCGRKADKCQAAAQERAVIQRKKPGMLGWSWQAEGKQRVNITPSMNSPKEVAGRCQTEEKAACTRERPGRDCWEEMAGQKSKEATSRQKTMNRVPNRLTGRQQRQDKAKLKIEQK